MRGGGSLHAIGIKFESEISFELGGENLESAFYVFTSMSENLFVDEINAEVFLSALTTEYAKSSKQKARSKFKETHS